MAEPHHYSNGEITVIWRPELCIHSTKCWRELPSVFKPKEKPWVHPENASTQEIARQVSECPSGALTSIPNKDL